MSKPFRSNTDLPNMLKLIFFIGSFCISLLNLFVILIAALNSNSGLQAPFILSHPTIANILILIVFFMTITHRQNHKFYYWFCLAALISSAITLIFSSAKMAEDIELLINRDDIFNFFFRLHQIILPLLYLFFYLCINEDDVLNKKSLLIIFVYPLFYVIAIQFLVIFGATNHATIKGLEMNLSNFQYIEKLFLILKLMFKFLPLTPFVLGIFFLKSHFMNNSKIKSLCLILGTFLIGVSLSGCWYPFPLSKQVFKAINTKEFARVVAHNYASLTNSNYQLTNSNYQNQDVGHKISADNKINNEIIFTSKDNLSIYKDRYSGETIEYEELAYIKTMISEKINNQSLKQGNAYKYTYQKKKYILRYSNSNKVWYKAKKGLFDFGATNLD